MPVCVRVHHLNARLCVRMCVRMCVQSGGGITRSGVSWFHTKNTLSILFTVLFGDDQTTKYMLRLMNICDLTCIKCRIACYSSAAKKNK